MWDEPTTGTRKRDAQQGVSVHVRWCMSACVCQYVSVLLHVCLSVCVLVPSSRPCVCLLHHVEVLGKDRDGSEGYVFLCFLIFVYLCIITYISSVF